jgi:hypothetical protein
MILWRVTDRKYKTEYIRANNLDEAKAIFDKRNYNPGVEFEPIDETIQAVYFSDNLFDPAFFRGTKAQARKGGNLYIKQWGLDAVIDRIETM